MHGAPGSLQLTKHTMHLLIIEKTCILGYQKRATND